MTAMKENSTRRTSCYHRDRNNIHTDFKVTCHLSYGVFFYWDSKGAPISRGETGAVSLNTSTPFWRQTLSSKTIKYSHQNTLNVYVER